MNLKHLSKEALRSQTKVSVSCEKDATFAVLHHIREVDDRRLWAEWGHATLFQYVMDELGYDGPSASRRVNAMILLRAVPEAEEKVRDGKLNLTQLNTAQVFFNREDLKPEEKRVVMQELEGLSCSKTQKKLMSLTDPPEVHFKEKVKVVTPELSEVKFYATDELLEDLEKLRGLLAHSHPGMSLSDLIAHLAKLGLKKLDPAQQEVRARKSLPPAEVTAQQRISKPLFRAVWKRDQGRCIWKDPTTGKCCGSHFRLQVDHIIPWALGGETRLEKSQAPLPNS